MPDIKKGTFPGPYVNSVAGANPARTVRVSQDFNEWGARMNTAPKTDFMGKIVHVESSANGKK